MHIRDLALAVTVTAALLTGCAPKVSPPAASAVPIPAAAMDTAFNGCTWQKVTGKTLSIWAYACGTSMGNVHLVADDAVPGFDIESASTKSRSLAIRVFTKPAGAPIDAALPAIRAASPGAHSDSCVLVAAPPVDFLPGKLYTLEPTGTAKAAFDAGEQSGNYVDPPCGELGVSYVGDHVFKVLDDDATKVVFFDMGSEIQIFDPKTLTVNKS